MFTYLKLFHKTVSGKGWALAACLFLTGCNGVSLQATYYDDDGSQAMPFQEISPVLESAIGDRRFVVIRDISAWFALWDEHSARYNPRPATPSINFSQNMVLAVFAGTRNNSCYRISIQSVTRRFNPDRIEVTFRDSFASGSTTCAAVLTNPSMLVVTPYSPLPIEYVQLP